MTTAGAFDDPEPTAVYSSPGRDVGPLSTPELGEVELGRLCHRYKDEVTNFFKELASFIKKPIDGTPPMEHKDFRIDILACSVAAGAGIELIDHLESITDVNFAASIDPTGAGDEVEGGFDYDLETEAGLCVATMYFDVDKIALWHHAAGLDTIGGAASASASASASSSRGPQGGIQKAAGRMTIINSLVQSIRGGATPAAAAVAPVLTVPAAAAAAAPPPAARERRSTGASSNGSGDGWLSFLKPMDGDEVADDEMGVGEFPAALPAADYAPNYSAGAAPAAETRPPPQVKRGPRHLVGPEPDPDPTPS